MAVHVHAEAPLVEVEGLLQVPDLEHPVQGPLSWSVWCGGCAISIVYIHTNNRSVSACVRLEMHTSINQSIDRSRQFIHVVAAHTR